MSNPVNNNHNLNNASLRIFSSNICSLKNKVTSLNAEILIHQPDIVTIQETWLNHSIPDSDLSIPNFSIIRRDRPSRGGGVAIYISDHLAWSSPDIKITSSVEYLCIDVHLGTKTFRICNFYRPPDSPISWLDSFYETLESVSDTRNDLIIMGDFNFDFLVPAESKNYINILNSFCLYQLVKEPTHFTLNRQSCLDHFIFRQTNQSIVNTINVFPPFDSDHCSILVDIGRHACRKSTLKTQWLYNDGDYVRLSDDLMSCDWSFIEDMTVDVDDVAQRFCDQLDVLLKRHIPTRQFYLRPNDADWMTSDIRTKQRKRNRIHNKAKRVNTPESWYAYRVIRNEVNSMIRRAKRTSNDRLFDKINSFDSNQSGWWKLVNSCFNSNANSIPTLITGPDNAKNFHHDDFSKANALNDFFTNVTIINDDNIDFPRLTPLTNCRLDSIEITVRDVIDAIDDIAINKSPGPDYISPIILKNLKLAIAPILTRLYNRSLNDSKFPAIWKKSHVIPIHKKDSRNNPSNYRPISLTSILSKVFEKAVLKYLLSHLLGNDLLYEFQSGFLPNHSTSHQLIEICHRIAANIKDHKATTIVFADISRAFDRLSHRGLYSKFDLYGFSNSVKNWLYSFLTGRVQRTCVNGVLSDWSRTLAGVAQGSVLGPLMFLLMINDLPSHLHNPVRLFADDTSILFTHQPNVDISDQIDQETSRLKEWTDTWMIDINATKTKSMSITLAKNRIIPTPSLNNILIDNVTSHKHLGLVLNNTLTWNDHIDYIVKKTSKRIGILRSLKYRLSRECLRTIYISHIRSVLEYCDVVWDGCTAAQALTLERLQRDIMRIITGLPTYCRLDYLYSDCGLPPLAERRREHCILLLFKSVVLKQGPRYFSLLAPPLMNDPSVRNNRHIKTFSPYPVTRSATFLQTFFPKTTSDWNLLDVSARCAVSIGIFKRMTRAPAQEVPVLFNKPRFASILYSRLKYNCSSLKSDLHHANLVDSPSCDCNTGIENLFHYLYNCPYYDVQREKLMYDLDRLGLTNLSIQVLFNPDPELGNVFTIQSCVYRYIISTNRFLGH